MSEVDLDLDALAPDTKKVKLNGRVIEVAPPKFKTLLEILKLADKFGKGQELDQNETVKALESLRNALVPIVPALSEDDFDLSLVQMMTLIEFVVSMTSPTDQKALENEGLTVKSDKKKELDSENLSQTS